MEIRVLGSECARCLRLEFLLRQVLDDLRAKVKLEWVIAPSAFSGQKTVSEENR